MAFKVYQPAVQVLLQKQVRRKDGVASRYSPPDIIDLTPFLGDGGNVRTRKGLHEPAGAFSISFADKVEPRVSDTVYALVEPMDVIEIRAAREPHKYAGGKLPLIMRGFVSSVSRSENMGADGAPNRTVVIEGQDAGKLWQIHRVFFQLSYLKDGVFLDKYMFQVITGVDIKVLPVSEFMAQLVRWMNRQVDAMAAYTERQLLPFKADCTVPEGQVAPEIAAPLQGSAWSFAEHFADRPWNELWIEDTEEAPVLHFRPTPYYDLDGKLIMHGAAKPDTIDVSAEELVSLNVTHSDMRIANVFWTPPGASLLDTGMVVATAAYQAGLPLDFQHANNRPELYGFRPMQIGTALLPNYLTTVPSSQDQVSRPDANKYVLWHQQRGADLKAMNRDSGVLEEGQAMLRGDEKLKVGRYLRLTRGDVVSEAYLTAVMHMFQPLSTWTTAVMLERGTGFLVRNKMDPSPYWAEGRPGVYG